MLGVDDAEEKMKWLVVRKRRENIRKEWATRENADARTDNAVASEAKTEAAVRVHQFQIGYDF